MFRFYSCSKFCILLGFYNSIANAIDNAIGVTDSLLQHHRSITFGFNSILKVLLNFQQSLFYFTYFFEPLIDIQFLSFYFMADFSFFQHIINVY